VGIGAVLLDVDGVLVMSWRPLPGARRALDWLRSEGVPFRLVTNATMRSREWIARTLADAGLPVGEKHVVTATLATAEHLRRHHPGARCFLLAADEAREDLEGIRWVEDDAEVVVVGGPGPWFTFDRLNRAFRMLSGGASLVAMQRNLSWRTDEGLMLDAGAFVTGLEAAAGVQAVTIGKPNPAFFEAALATMGASPADALMVGDDLEADVLGAQDAGLVGALVRTGKFRPEALEGLERGPDHVIDSVADLPGLVELLR
jgi:HAD superfamily hydrolase (TIGR01458 family)